MRSTKSSVSTLSYTQTLRIGIGLTAIILFLLWFTIVSHLRAERDFAARDAKNVAELLAESFQAGMSAVLTSMDQAALRVSEDAAMGHTAFIDVARPHAFDARNVDITILSPAGQILQSTAKRSHLFNFSNKTLFKCPSIRTHDIEQPEVTIDASWWLHTARLVKAPSGKCVGVVVVSKNIIKLAESIDNRSLSDIHGFATVVSQDGVALFTNSAATRATFEKYTRAEYSNLSHAGGGKISAAVDHSGYMVAVGQPQDHHHLLVAVGFSLNDALYIYDNIYNTLVCFTVIISIFVLIGASWGGYIFFKLTEVNKNLHVLSLTDCLTGLPNRAGICSRVERAAAQEASSRPALIFIDLDDFKELNDTHGHHIGDCVLVEVAKMLRSAVGTNGEAGRLGGDEFVVIIDEPDASTTAARISEKLAARFGAELVIENHRIGVSASLGIATLEPGETVSELFKKADHAMYRAKAKRRGRVTLARRARSSLSDVGVYPEHCEVCGIPTVQ